MYLIKNASLLFICLIFTISGYAQETKNISVKRKNGYFTIIEHYRVLSAAPEIKQGPYSARISLYSEQGQFEQGNKIGIWASYYNDELVQQYDFSSHTFLPKDVSGMITSVLQLGEHGYAIKDLGSRGVFLGGDAKMGAILLSSARYPADAMKNHIQGWVTIEAKLDKEGKLTEEKAISHNGYGLEEEGLRVFKLFPADWLPVWVEGKPVDVLIQVRLGFELSYLQSLKY